MAGNIVVTPLTGSVASLTPFTIYRNQDAFTNTGAITGGLIHLHFNILSPNGWQAVKYAGFQDQDAKFMAGNTSRMQIAGYVMATNDSEDRILASMRSLLARNKDKGFWSVKIANTTMTPGKGAVIEDISAGDMGDGTGARWPFTINFRFLGK